MLDGTKDTDLVAACGLYCGACDAHRKGTCPGCAETSKAGWCQVRACCREHGYANCANCADCGDFDDPRDCGKFNGAMAKVFGVLFNSNRAACIDMIKERGIYNYAHYMARHGKPTIPRWGKLEP